MSTLFNDSSKFAETKTNLFGDRNIIDKSSLTPFSSVDESKFDSDQMDEIRLGLKHKVDVSQYANPKFDHHQMEQIRLGLEHSVDVSVYANPKFNYGQMEQIRLSLEHRVSVSQYADPKLMIFRCFKFVKVLNTEWIYLCTLTLNSIMIR